MKIEKLNDNQIRCTLTSADLANRKIKLSELAYGTEKARNLFQDMMVEANEQFGFNYDNAPLMVEDLDTMHVVLHLTKDTTPPIVWELFSRRIIDVTAAGVSMDLVENVPWFAFDYDTASLKGWDEGSLFPFEQILS